MNKTPIWAPKVLDKIRLAAISADEFIVESNQEYNRSRPECIGDRVLLDGVEREIFSVERRLPNGPIRSGEIIGLIVRDIPDRSDDSSMYPAKDQNDVVWFRGGLMTGNSYKELLRTGLIDGPDYSDLPMFDNRNQKIVDVT